MNAIRKSLALLGLGTVGVLAGATPAFAQKVSFVPGEDVLPVPGKSLPSIQTAKGGFVENKGQWDSRALFRRSASGLTYWVTDDGVVYDAHVRDGDQLVGQVVSMSFYGAGSSGKTYTSSEGKAKFNTDFVGLGGKGTVTGVGTYSGATVHNVYPGISVHHYNDAKTPRFDYIVEPGADVSNIAMRYEGASGIRVTPEGNVEIQTQVGSIMQAGLFAYQTIGGVKRQIPASFVMDGFDRVRVQVGAYDKRVKLVIDPLVYGTYVGGDGDFDESKGVVSNNAGQVYVTGSTTNYSFPITAGPYSTNLKDSQDAYVFALTGDAYDVNYVAYIGGVGTDEGDFLQLDQYGSVWLAGMTDSATIPQNLIQEIGVGNVTPNPPTAGTFRVGYQGAFADPIAFDTNAANVQDALNGLATAPAGGFTATGGALPDTNIKVSANGPDLTPIIVQSRTELYTVNDEAGDGTAWSISWQAPAPPRYGFRPISGSFKLTLTRANGAAVTTGDIRWNATPAQVRAALLAAPVSFPAGDLVVNGTALPAGTINIQISGTSVPTQFAGPFVTNGATTFNGSAVLNGGTYSALNRNNRAFLLRFQPSVNKVLDPATNEVSYTVGGYDNPTHTLAGFKIKQVPTPTGPVEMTFAGTTSGALPEITRPTPSAANFGYILQMNYTAGSAPTTVLSRSSYIGGSAPNTITGLAVDTTGAVYVAGTVTSTTNVLTGPTSTVFATSNGVYANGNLLRLSDGYIRKYDTSGTMQYSALLGGSGDDQIESIAVDALGNAYVAGIARSFNFPRTVGAFGQTFSSSNSVFVTKINPSASQLLYSTNLKTSGNVHPTRLEVDSKGNAYVAGLVGYDLPFPTPAPTIPGSIVVTPAAPAVPGQEAGIDPTYTSGNLTYPVTAPAPGSSSDGFLNVLNSTATGLLYGTYIGQDGNEQVDGLYIDGNDSVYLVGLTTLFPTTIPDSNNSPISSGALAAGYNLNAGFLSPLAFKSVGDPYGDGFLIKLRVALPTLKTLTLAPNQVAGGRGSTSTGTVTLQNPAPVGGTQVTIRALHPAVARVTPGGATSVRIIIPEGQTTGTFTVYSRAVLVPSFCDIKAELDGDFLVSRLNVRPWLDSLTLTTDSLPGGNTLQGTVTLFQPAPAGGVDVALSTSSPLLVKFPSPTITVPAGQQTVTFNIDTEGVATATDVTVTASVDSVGVTQPLKLLPATVVSVVFNPATVNGGEDSTGTFFLDGKAAAGTVVTLSQSGLAITIPASVTLAAGATQGTFAVNTPAVTGASTSSTVTASVNGSNANGTLIVEGNDVASISLSSNSVIGGATVIGTVTLSRPASPSGFVVPLTNSNPTAGSLNPTSVTIAPGATTATFVIQTFGVVSTQNLIVTANKTGYNPASATLQVRALNFTFTLNPTSIAGGGTSTGTVTLTGGELAPTGGLTLSLSSDNAAAQVPATVTIAAGQASATFNVTTSRVSADVVANISATATTGVVKTAALTVLAPSLLSISVAPTSPLGGQTATGTVTVSSAAPAGGLVVNLSSSNTAVAQVPSSVTIAAGATTANFTVTTSPVSSPTGVTISATRAGVTKTATITVQVSTIASLVFNPTTVKGGNSSTATVTLNQAAPAGGLVITLTADKPAFVSMPSTVTVPAGATQVQFTVGTAQVTRLVGVVITAKVQATGVGLSGTLFIDRNVGARN